VNPGTRSSETARERFVVFECDGESCVGVVSEPLSARHTTDVGVAIIVGGPQYRVGSHRQFMLLARRLASAGIPVLRFDYRGMGDSSGAMRSFEQTERDICAALDAFQDACPGVRNVALWGLCDGASAAALYWQSSRDRRVAAMAMLNPWVRSEASLAKTHVRHYYGRRALEKAFWTKLLHGGVDVVGAIKSIARGLIASPDRARSAEPAFRDRMADCLRDFGGPVLILLSERDITAKEFAEYARSSSRWRGILDRPNVEREEVARADHTFSSADWRGEVESRTLAWLKRSVLRASEHRPTVPALPSVDAP
jgi:exosortase A-associated hydrolase 1